MKSILEVTKIGNRYWHDKNGFLHRVDGPAYEDASGYKSWWINGHRHRIGGPACESIDGSKRWYIHGVFYTEGNYKEKIQEMKI